MSEPQEFEKEEKIDSSKASVRSTKSLCHKKGKEQHKIHGKTIC